MSEKDVEMGEYDVASGSEVLKALGIGSCVAVCLYTDRSNFGAMAHVMLPAEEGEASNKHADILIYQMLEEIDRNEEVSKHSLKAKIFGGASMFGESTLNIGKKNVKSVKNILNEENISIVEEDTGGNKGRAVWFNTRSKDVAVRKPGQKTKRY
jgi:Chemotaxis protein; stimulates methylation of MCP proteins